MNGIELQWDVFWDWIRRSGLVGSSSERKYRPAFRETFERIYQSDLVSVYECYRQNFEENDNTILISMSGHYLQYHLELNGPLGDVVPGRMVLLKDLFHAAKKYGLELDRMLDRVTKIGPIKKTGFLTADIFRTPKGKLTPDGFYYFAQRELLVKLWADPDLQENAVTTVCQMLRDSCTDVYAFRECLSGMAELLVNRWTKDPSFQGSGAQQKLLQLLSLRSNLWIPDGSHPGEAYTELLQYASRLLLALSADLYGCDATGYGTAVIPSEDDPRYWLWLLVLAPFQRNYGMTQMFFLPTGRPEDAQSRMISNHIMRLVRNGLLWTYYPPRATTPQIKLIPCAYRLLVGRETALPAPLWKMQGKNPSEADRLEAAQMALLRKLLRRLCNWMVQQQDQALKALKPEQLCTMELFRPTPELGFILASAPCEDERHRSTVGEILRVQIRSWWAQSLGHELENVNTACLRLKELAQVWGEQYTVIASEMGVSDVLMHHAERLLRELYDDNREKSVGNGLKYAIFAEQSARECLADAKRKGSTKSFIRSGCAQVWAKLYQMMNIQESVSVGSMVLDYLVPSWQQLRQCTEQLLLNRIGIEYQNLLVGGGRRFADQQRHMEQLQELIDNAAQMYNQACKRLDDDGGCDYYELLSFDSEASKDELERQADSIKILCETLVQEIKTADSTLWTGSCGHSRANHRSFHQNWYLSDQDSVFVTNRENIELSKRHLMFHLLSAQNAVFSINQIMDNRAIRELSRNTAFLWMVKKGKVGISLYGSIYDLVQYAAVQMMPADTPVRKPYLWSSLPEEFNNSTTARREAADYLRAMRSESELSQVFRDEIVSFAEGLRALNEAIPYDVRNRHYQRSAPPNMITFMNNNYDWIQKQGTEAETCLVHQRISEIIGPNGYRTDYKFLVDLCRKLDGDDLTAEQGSLLELVSGFDDPAGVMEKVEFLMNDLYNRMLANTFTDLADFSYTQEQRRLLRYDEAKPITDGGCVLYRQSYTLTDTGKCIDWSALVDRAAAQDEIISLHPQIHPEDMVRILADDAVEYQFQESADGVVLRPSQVVLRTDDKDGASVLLELVNDGKTIHMETGKEEKK